MVNLNSLKKMDKDDLLNLIGLETRRDTTDTLLPVLGAFAAGILVGAGLGLLLAPKPGNQLRDDLKQRLASGQELINNAVNRSGDNAQQGTSSTPRNV
ncbi:YtxH domain-containing protein [Pyxidicoccus xibeiensis]|uniref:YtxH domain-containing protein n=1 Tax=Pyxidicoccus xibeiensis TaxID=2906759 RepID=UPI0020A79BDB|nr:YtxH domain-containing protein [Pyxidicoccus xibeiensis]MCP3141122.1 YtxH domain-containing protein [Pyxidicoccus xibeiensis]